jgi:hypothetical protein
LTASHPGSTTHLIDRFARGALGVFELPLAAALLAEIAPLEQFILDLFHRATVPLDGFGAEVVNQAQRVEACGPDINVGALGVLVAEPFG